MTDEPFVASPLFDFVLPDNGLRYRTAMFRADVHFAVTKADIPHLYVSRTWWEEAGRPTRIELKLTPGETFWPTILKTKLKLEHVDARGKSRREIAQMDLTVTQIFVKLGVLDPLQKWDVEVRSAH